MPRFLDPGKIFGTLALLFLMSCASSAVLHYVIPPALRGQFAELLQHRHMCICLLLLTPRLVMPSIKIR